jgi:hypothetical protein
MFEPLPDLAYFRLLVGDSRAIPLLEAAASIGVIAYPSLDLQGTLSSFDDLAGQVADHCRGASTEMARLQRVSRFSASWDSPATSTTTTISTIACAMRARDPPRHPDHAGTAVRRQPATSDSMSPVSPSPVIFLSGAASRRLGHRPLHGTQPGP